VIASRTSLFAVLAVFAPVGLARSDTAVNPVDAVSKLRIELIQKKKLRLLPSDGGKVHLDGELVVVFSNDGDQTLSLTDHDVHGLVFRSKDAPPFVIVHDCKCGYDATHAWQGWTLGPGQQKTLRFADWGCSGDYWTPPPPGAYLVSYRNRVFTQKPVVAVGTVGPSVEVMVSGCQQQLASEVEWAGAAQSNAIEVTLGKPRLKTGSSR